MTLSANADRLRVSYVKEVTFGTMPATTLSDVRFTSDSLNLVTGTAVSAEIRDDRQVNDIIRTNLSTAGELGIELSYAAHDDLLASALFASTTWTAAITVASDTVTVDAAAGTFTFTAEDPDGDGITVGRWVKFNGMANAGNMIPVKVSAVSTTVITTLQKDNLTSEAATSVCVAGAEIVNGVTQSSWSIEKDFTDIVSPSTEIYQQYKGLVVDTFGLSVQADQIITGSFGFLGKTMTASSSTAGGGYNVAPTNEVMNAVEDVQTIIEGVSDYDTTQFTVQLNNNVRARQQIGTLGAVSMGSGTLGLTGTLQAYFSTAAAMDKYIAFTETSLAKVVTDATGNSYVIDIPAVNFTSGQTVAGGQNQDIIADLAWTAKRKATEDATIRIVKFAA